MNLLYRLHAASGLTTHRNEAYWTGAGDVGNNDTFVWVGTGEVFPRTFNLV